MTPWSVCQNPGNEIDLRIRLNTIVKPLQRFRLVNNPTDRCRLHYFALIEKGISKSTALQNQTSLVVVTLVSP
jgi:hypothetical protein